jgi:uncharacterized RDD family membrane protein YckC
MPRPAPIVHRCAAFVLDGLLTLLGAAAITAVTSAPLLGAGGWQQPDGLGKLMIIFVVAQTLLQFIYHAWSLSRSGATAGKRLLGLRVETSAGKRPAFVDAGLRGTVGYSLSGLPLGLGFWRALRGGRGQTWHDQLFRTRVVRGNSGAASAPMLER